MWFLFGLITLFSFGAYFLYRRIKAGWKGELAYAGDISYSYQVLQGKYGIHHILIGIEAPEDLEFVLKQETALDRFFKFIKLVKEFQTGHDAFDERVYVVSDNPQFQKQLARDRNLTGAVLDAFISGNHHYAQAKELRCHSSKLWVKFKVTSQFERDDVSAIAEKLVPALQRIKQGLASMALLSPQGRRDPFVIKAAVLLAISTAMAVNAGVHLYRLMWLETPFTLDLEPLLQDAALLGGIIIVVMVALALILLGRSARTHLVLIELLLVGSFGAVGNSFISLRDANMAMDVSTVESHQVAVVDKRVSHGRRSTSYYVTLDDWLDQQGTREVKVGSGFYALVVIGEQVEVEQKAGYLGYRWVERLRRQYTSP